MGAIKVEVIKEWDTSSEDLRSRVRLKYEGREVPTWVDLLKAMQREYEFDLILTDDTVSADRTPKEEGE